MVSNKADVVVLLGSSRSTLQTASVCWKPLPLDLGRQRRNGSARRRYSRPLRSQTGLCAHHTRLSQANCLPSPSSLPMPTVRGHSSPLLAPAEATVPRVSHRCNSFDAQTPKPRHYRCVQQRQRGQRRPPCTRACAVPAGTRPTETRSGAREYVYHKREHRRTISIATPPSALRASSPVVIFPAPLHYTCLPDLRLIVR